MIVIAAGGAWFFLDRTGGTPGTPDEPAKTASYIPESARDMIRVNQPAPGTTITSPLAVGGEARGSWFFEASFPVRLLDANGDVLAQSIAETPFDWMTEDFVTFRANLAFNQPVTETGTLVLQRDNPSNLPENAAEVRIPVRFGDISGETTTLRVHFSTMPEGSTECNTTAAVERTVPKTQAVARAALEELLKGPVQTEKAQGLFTSINPNVKVQSLTIKDGVARVDFDEQLQYQVGGSCRIAAVRAEITDTLKEFPTIKSVIISINGETELILQP